MLIGRPRVWLTTAVTAAVAVAGVTVAGSAQAAAGCRVTYTVSSQWQGGFGANVTVNNLGDAVSAWQLTWSFSAGQTITQVWNGTFTQTGAQVGVTNASWNGAIPTGGTASFGFNGSWTGSNPVPTSFSLNGTACTGSVPSTPPTTSPTSSPPTSPPPTGTTTAWQRGQFVVQDADVVRRSNIVFERANTSRKRVRAAGQRHARAPPRGRRTGSPRSSTAPTPSRTAGRRDGWSSPG